MLSGLVYRRYNNQAKEMADDHYGTILHLVGRYMKSRARPMIDRFQHEKDRNDTGNNRGQPITDSQYIGAMNPPTTYRKRRILQAVQS